MFCSLYARVDNHWGALDNETGKWDGVIGSLLKGDVDIAWSTLTETAQRFSAVDFLLPYDIEHYSLVCRQ